MASKITILGGGNGAFAAAADLTSRGYEITIYENPEYKSNIDGILKEGVIQCVGVGPVGEFKVCSSSKNVSKRSPKRLAPWST